MSFTITGIWRIMRYMLSIKTIWYDKVWTKVLNPFMTLLRCCFILTLFGQGGAHWTPLVTYLCISLQICVRARKKSLTFLSHEFGKGQCTFHPVKLYRFAEKNKVRRKYQNFIRGNPYEPGQTPLWQTKVSKVKHFFGGFWASKLHESFWIW